MKKIHFGYIAPVEYLHLIPEHATFHLILAHLLDNKKYVEFYKKKIKRGDTVILDNSAFEFKKALSAKEIFGFIDRSEIEPTYVVAPDYPFESWEKTWDSTLSFLDKAKDKPYKVMAVPQSEKGDADGWIRCYIKMMQSKDVHAIGMSILGIPNAFCSITGTDDIAFNRIFATAHLLNEGIAKPGKKWHHYLGLGNGPRELLIQRQLELIDSNDSSSPFWHGVQGIMFDNTSTGLKDGKSPIEVDFEVKKKLYTTDDELDIKANIDWMEKVILK